MTNIDKFIGVPYGFAEHSFESADCIGLVRLFYAENQWTPSFYDGEFTKDWYKDNPLRMLRYFCKHLDRTRDVKKLTYGDIVYFSINGEGHCGIWLPYNHLLTTFPSVKQWDGSWLPSRSMKIHKSMWIGGFVAGFKRRHS